MNRMRILKGEFEGQILHEGVVIEFAAIRNDLGLSASFVQNQTGLLFPEIELFATLEREVYGEESN